MGCAVVGLAATGEDDFAAMKWTQPRNTRGAVDRAGRSLCEVLCLERDSVLGVVDNWRSAHSYPLHALTMNLRRRVSSVDQGALIAQRLKRLSSIISKLSRQPRMQLCQMQDIGGCRAVVKDVHCLNALVSKFEKGQHKCWIFKEKYDYVKRPKDDGYRSVHFVYQYSNDSDERACYNKLRIEVQLRSRMQHAWATALETVDTFTRQALKANRGSRDWQRFFTLMGHSIALREGQNAVPGAPFSKRDLLVEINDLVERLNVMETLAGWTSAVKATDRTGRGHFFLLTLNMTERRIKIDSYAKSESELAAYQYSILEKENLDRPEIQTVLVSVDSLDALRLAYPNYYLDTSAFVELVKTDIEELAHIEGWKPRRSLISLQVYDGLMKAKREFSVRRHGSVHAVPWRYAEGAFRAPVKLTQLKRHARYLPQTR